MIVLKPFVLFFKKIRGKFMIYRHRRYVFKAIEGGLKLGKNVTIMADVRFDPPHYSLISIGDNTTIGPDVAFIAHDAAIFKALNHSRMGCIDIKENCFIGERALILPGVTIGPNVIIGAGSVVISDIPENSVAIGNPAKIIKTLDMHFLKHEDQILKNPVIEYQDFYANIPVKLNTLSSTQKKLFYTTNQAKSLRANFRFNI